MEEMAPERNSSSLVLSTVVAAVTHGIIPLFWLFCSVLIVPRYVAISNLSMENVREAVPVLVAFSHFMARHYVVYLAVLVLILIADGVVHYSLLRASMGVSARLWSYGIAIIEVAISLFLYLPLRNAVATMEV